MVAVAKEFTPVTVISRPDFTPATSEFSDFPPLPGERIEGGKLVGPEKLAKLYQNAIIRQRPVDPDPTIFKSTAKLTMEQFCLDPQEAERRAQNIHTAAASEMGTSAAGFATLGSEGLGFLLNADAFDHSRNGQNPHEFATWHQVMWLTAHEAVHASPDAVDNSASTEDLGPLGKVLIKGYKYGLRATQEYRGEAPNLLQMNVRFVPGGPIEATHIAEEVCAEIGRVNLMKKLGLLGLHKVGITSDYMYDLTPVYRFLRQALIDIDKPYWQEYTSGVLSPKSLLHYHQNSDRAGFHLALGGALARQNVHGVSLSEEAMRGLGALGFAAFVHAGDKDRFSDPRPVLTALREEPITPEILIQRAHEVIDWFYVINDIQR